jgi:hypothetical protein
MPSSKSTTSELGQPGIRPAHQDHLLMVSRPDAVAKVIEEAAASGSTVRQ